MFHSYSQCILACLLIFSPSYVLSGGICLSGASMAAIDSASLVHRRASCQKASFQQYSTLDTRNNKHSALVKASILDNARPAVQLLKNYMPRLSQLAKSVSSWSIPHHSISIDILCLPIDQFFRQVYDNFRHFFATHFAFLHASTTDSLHRHNGSNHDVSIVRQQLASPDTPPLHHDTLLILIENSVYLNGKLVGFSYTPDPHPLDQSLTAKRLRAIPPQLLFCPPPLLEKHPGSIYVRRPSKAAERVIKSLSGMSANSDTEHSFYEAFRMFMQERLPQLFPRIHRIVKQLVPDNPHSPTSAQLSHIFDQLSVSTIDLILSFTDDGELIVPLLLSMHQQLVTSLEVEIQNGGSLRFYTAMILRKRRTTARIVNRMHEMLIRSFQEDGVDRMGYRDGLDDMIGYMAVKVGERSVNRLRATMLSGLTGSFKSNVEVLVPAVKATYFGDVWKHFKEILDDAVDTHNDDKDGQENLISCQSRHRDLSSNESNRTFCVTAPMSFEFYHDFPPVPSLTTVKHRGFSHFAVDSVACVMMGIMNLMVSFIVKQVYNFFSSSFARKFIAVFLSDVLVSSYRDQGYFIPYNITTTTQF